MKVTSKKSIHFPKFNWGIEKGETRELPTSKEAQEVILAHPAISRVDQASKEPVHAPQAINKKQY